MVDGLVAAKVAGDMVDGIIMLVAGIALVGFGLWALVVFWAYQDSERGKQDRRRER